MASGRERSGAAVGALGGKGAQDVVDDERGVVKNAKNAMKRVGQPQLGLARGSTTLSLKGGRIDGDSGV